MCKFILAVEAAALIEMVVAIVAEIVEVVDLISVINLTPECTTNRLLLIVVFVKADYSRLVSVHIHHINSKATFQPPPGSV